MKSDYIRCFGFGISLYLQAVAFKDLELVQHPVTLFYFPSRIFLFFLTWQHDLNELTDMKL